MTGRRRVTRSAATAVALTAALAGCGGSGSATPSRTAPASGTSSTTRASTTSTTTETTSTPSAGGAPAGALTVSPLDGRPGGTERFTIRLHSPIAAGRGLRAVGELSVTRSPRAAAPTACVSERTLAVALPGGAGGPGSVAAVSLGPRQLRAPWCRGRFSARVVELVRPVCGRGQMCPQFIRVAGTLGPVTFRIS